MTFEFLRKLKRIADRAFFRILFSLFRSGGAGKKVSKWSFPKDVIGNPGEMSLRLVSRRIRRLTESSLQFVQSPRRPVLLIVRTDGIGDFVYFARYTNAIKIVFKDYSIALVCRKETAEFARFVKGIDMVIGFNSMAYRRNYIYRFIILRKIRKLKPEEALYVSFHREHIGDEMTLLSGAKTTICFSGNDECIHDSMRFTNNNYYSRIINVDDHTNEGEKYSKLFGDLSIQQITTSQFKVIEPSNLESTSKITFLARKPYMVFAPGSSSNKRIWSPRRYSTLINEVLHKSDLNVVICGSKSEESLLKNLTINENNRIIIAAGYPLVEIFFLMKEAKLFIGNDSGLLHFAAVLGIPSIGIIGGGHYCRYFPYGNAKIVTNFLPCFECNWRCIHSTPLCLTQISVDDVFSEVEKLLG